jgi:hypothetical protein
LADVKTTSFPSRSKEPEVCQTFFRKHLRQPHSTNPSQKYPYQVRAFKKAGLSQHKWVKEQLIFRQLQACSDQQQLPPFTPKLHQLLECDNYALIITDRWDGNVAQLLNNKNLSEADRRVLLDHIQQLLARLHTCGFAYGKFGAQDFLYRQGSGRRLEVALGPLARVVASSEAVVQQRDWSFFKCMMVTEFHL